MYEALKARMERWRDDNDRKSEGGSEMSLHMGTTALSAGMAGSIAAAVTTPIDVIKTRIMLEAGEGKEGQEQQRGTSWKHSKKNMTLWSVGKDVFEKEGTRGLFRGGVLRASWTALGLGLYLGSYEGGRKFLEDRREGKKKVDIVEGESAY